MDTLTNGLSDFIVDELKKTKLNREFDLTQVKSKITELVADVTLRLDKKDTTVILNFIKNSKLQRGKE